MPITPNLNSYFLPIPITLCKNELTKSDFPGGSDSKASAYNVGDLGSIPGSRRSPVEGNGNPLLYSCLENPIDRGAWWSTIHGVTKSWTQLSKVALVWILFPNTSSTANAHNHKEKRKQV